MLYLLADARFIEIFFAVLTVILFAVFALERRLIFDESSARFLKIIRSALLLGIILIVAHGVILSLLQYQVWKEGDGFAVFLLPPHTPISYFLGYVWMHFGKEILSSIFAALALLFTMSVANRFSGNRFFYREEPWLAAFGTLVAPWPAGFLVMMIVFGVGLILQAALILARRRKRLSLIWFWLPATLVAIVFGDVISGWIGLERIQW